MTNQTTFSILDDAIATSQVLLTKYAFGDELLGDFTTAFGYKYDRYAASDFITQWQTGNFSSFPEIEIRSSAEINGANGAYSVDTNKIYIAEEYLLANADDIGAVSDLVIEEYGHYVDSRINSVDSAGDEGAIFSGLVRGESFTDGELQQLKLENDKAVVTLDGKEIAIEQRLIADNLLKGGNGNDSIDGGKGNDTIYGYGGNDTLYGGDDPRVGVNDGDDKLYGGDGNDILDGGQRGNDYLNGGNGNDKLYGGSGNDKLYGGTGFDQLFGESGDDLLEGGDNSDKLYGGSGNDKLYGDKGSEKGEDKLYGEDGNDELHGGNYNDTLDGGSGNDKLYGGNHRDKLYGGSGNDILDGDSGNDTLKGGSGDDKLYGEVGDDELYGDSGNDILKGNSGNDKLYGDDGNDILDGGSGNDTLIGGNGKDTFEVKNFNEKDYFDGGTGIDTIIFKTSDNRNLTVEWSENEELTVDGYVQNLRNIEVIEAGNGNDTFIGSSKDEIFNGGAGNDTLNGGDGNDTLYGSSGTNSLFGGEGIDTFVTESGGLQIIKDFERGVDKIDMAQAQVNQIFFDFETTPGSTIIKVDGQGRVRVEGSQVDSSSLINTSEDKDIEPQPLTSEQVKDLSVMLQQWAKDYARSVGKDPNKVQLVNNQLQMVGGDLTVIDYGEESTETNQGLQIENMSRNASMFFKNNSTESSSITFTYSDGKGYEISNQDTTEWTTGGTLGVNISKTVGVEASVNLPFGSASANSSISVGASYEQSWSVGGSNTKINTDNVNTQNQQQLTFNAPGGAVTKATAIATGGEYSGAKYEIPIAISGTIGIDLNGDGDASDRNEIKNLPVNAILQYYNPQQFVGEGLQKTFKLPEGQILFYNENTQAKVTGTADGAFINNISASAESAFDWSLNNPTTKQYNEGINFQLDRFGKPLGQGKEERYWLIEKAYSSRPHGAVLRIEGFNISQDFIGIDHNAINSDADILLGTDVGVGTDPANKLILQEDTSIFSKGKLVDGNIFYKKNGDINNKKMKKKYGKNYAIFDTTEILMGGTGDDFTTIDDNDVLAELIGVSPDQLLGSSRESLTRGDMTSNFMFGTQGTIWDNNLASSDGSNLLQLLETV